jgi:hypothetical protein
MHERGETKSIHYAEILADNKNMFLDERRRRKRRNGTKTRP